jgi:uncharacterized protein YndB with AHSA1/START domain
MAEFSTSIEIEAPPEIVYAYLVDGERMLRWMGEQSELDPVLGGRFEMQINGARFRGEYLELDPPRRVVLSWGIDGSHDLPPGASRVELTLTPTPSGTTLSLLHSGLPETRAHRHAAGWWNYLGWKLVIESFDEERLRGILAPDLRF